MVDNLIVGKVDMSMSMIFKRVDRNFEENLGYGKDIKIHRSNFRKFGTDFLLFSLSCSFICPLDFFDLYIHFSVRAQNFIEIFKYEFCSMIKVSVPFLDVSRLFQLKKMIKILRSNIYFMHFFFFFSLMFFI